MGNFKFSPKISLCKLYIHSSLRLYERIYTLSAYTLQHAHTCPLVLSQIYNREKLYGNKWVNYEFSPKISLFTLYFSHFTGTT